MRKKIIVRGPALSSSGYGEQTRFALRCLRKHQDKFDIYLLNLNWGRTGWIVSDDEERKWIDEILGKTQAYIQQNQPNINFDVSLQITIPNEFEIIAPVNIGYTAGIETTKAVPVWLEKCNIMNRIIVPSQHSKVVLENSLYRTKNEKEQDVELKTKIPIDVCGYAAREIKPKPLELELETSFNFLTVSQWGPRKNLESVISAFISEFNNEKEVGLIVKTNMTKNNYFDKLVVENRLRSFVQQMANSKDMKCKIYLLHGNLEENEMRGLYTHPTVKALVTATHGEGFGLPLFETVLCEKPVIAPGWSGHLDFLFAPKKDKETGKTKLRPHFVKVDYDIGQVQKDAIFPGLIEESSQWCYPKNYSLRAGFKEVFRNYGACLSNAKKLKEYIFEEFEENKQYDKFVNSVLSVLPAFSEPENFSQAENNLKNNNLLDDIVGL